MKKLLVAAALTLVALTTQAQDIKGIQIGMTKAEVEALNLPAVFTVAGVVSKYPMSPIKYDANNKVEAVIFFFNPKHFDTVLDAFKSKYPLDCETSTITTKVGVPYEQAICRYGNMSVRRFVGDINTSAVGISNMEAIMNQAEERKNKAKSDI